MASASTPSILSTSYNSFCDNIKETKSFNFQLSEQDVLELQEIFLTFGMHYIKTQNIESGRNIINTILGSLKYYQSIGAITDQAGLQEPVCDILVDMKMQGYYLDTILVNLENYFTVHAGFDFIWVELSASLLDQDIMNIKNIFDMYHVQESMPVIFVMYN